MIYLALASSSPAAVAKAIEGTGAPVPWAYLGRDYRRTCAWEKSLGSRFTRLSFASRLQELALSWRDAFLGWIAGASVRAGASISWWTSAIAEKNTLSDSLYHGICYLKIATELIAREETLLLVAEHESLLRAIEANAARPVKRTALMAREDLRLSARFLRNWMRYAVTSWKELRAVRATRDDADRFAGKTDRPLVIIHTCIDESYFGADGQPRDRYFGPLAKMLRDQGYEVRTMPWIYALRRPLPDAIAWFRSRAGEYLLPEDEYKVADYLWAARVVIAQLGVGRELTHFEGLDVRPLVRRVQLEQAGTETTARFIRYDRFLRRLKQRGMHIEVFVDMFENMASEKPQVMALREISPDTMTVGFQHYAALPPLQLFLRSTAAESRVAPIPDVIVCNSPYTARELENAGFPSERLRIGPSLRYPHMTTTPVTLERPRGKNVLVVLSLEESASDELLMKLFAAFENETSISFRVKAHPMAPANYLGGLLDRMPPAFTRATGELAPQLRDAGCAVVLGSTSAFELAVAAVPLVVAGRESDFDQNPLAGHPEFPRPAVSAEELRSAIVDRLNMPETEWERLRDWALKMRREAFVPISSRAARVFTAREDPNLESDTPQKVEAL